MKRTNEQNKALHLWLHMKAQQCREAGVTAQMAFAETVELEMSDEMMKVIWKTIQKALFNKKSTADLDKHGEIDEIYEHMNRFFAKEPFYLDGIDFPHDEDKRKMVERIKHEVEYPENNLEAPKF